jgi:arabinogalactan oligomer/maltooligosaccharide transport system permease protein
MSRAVPAALTHLVLIVASVFAVFPILWLLSTSFKPEADVFVTRPRLVPRRFTLGNYAHVLVNKEVRDERSQQSYEQALDSVSFLENADGTGNLVVRRLIAAGDNPESFVSTQQTKIAGGHLPDVLEIADRSQGDDVQIVFRLRPGADPERVARQIYNAAPDTIFLRWIWNSFVVTMLTSLLGLIFASTTAYAFSRYRFRGHRAGLMVFLVTQMFPGALLVVPLYNLLVTLKLLNTYLGLIIAYCTVALPFSVWMLKSFFDTIPHEIEEAAWVEGSTPVQTYYRIIMPLSVPGLAVVFFFNFISAWNEYMLALTFMSSTTMYTLPVGLTTFTHQFATDWHYMSAAAVIITIPVLVVFFFAQKFLVSGLVAGGVKG